MPDAPRLLSDLSAVREIVILLMLSKTACHTIDACGTSTVIVVIQVVMVALSSLKLHGLVGTVGKKVKRC